MRKQNLILAICLAMFLSFACVVGCGKKYDQPPAPPTEGHSGNVTDYPKCRLIERFGCQYVWCHDRFGAGSYSGGLAGGLVATDPACRPSAAVEKR
jgi:hypothetical protein